MQKDLPSTDSKAAPYGRDLQARKQLNTNDNHSSCNWFFTEKKNKSTEILAKQLRKLITSGACQKLRRDLVRNLASGLHNCVDLAQFVSINFKKNRILVLR